MTVLGILLSNILTCPWNVSATCSVMTLQRFVLASHMVSRMPSTCRPGLMRPLIFPTVFRKSCSPIIARSWGLTVMITPSAAESALMVRLPSEGQVSTSM